MLCKKCGSENREGRKFCSKCGLRLALTCVKCGAPNEPGEDFCGDCGAPLTIVATSHASSTRAPDPTIRVTAESSSAAIDAERKTVTALFADIKGSTELEQD